MDLPLGWNEWEPIAYNSTARGRRQVVRPKLPKLVFAGSSPVARSMNFPTLPSGGVVLFSRDIAGRADGLSSETGSLAVSCLRETRPQWMQPSDTSNGTTMSSASSCPTYRCASRSRASTRRSACTPTAKRPGRPTSSCSSSPSAS